MNSLASMRLHSQLAEALADRFQDPRRMELARCKQCTGERNGLAWKYAVLKPVRRARSGRCGSEGNGHVQLVHLDLEDTVNMTCHTGYLLYRLEKG